MANFTAALMQFMDPAALSTPQTWANFVGSLAQGHGADLQVLESKVQALKLEVDAARADQVPVGGGMHRLLGKDLKPDVFESNRKSDRLCKQWSEDVRAWLRRIDPDCGMYVKVAEDMTE